jgi:hypothetical protein
LAKQADALASELQALRDSEVKAAALADRQTTGGYPKIATIISADLPSAGRLPIGAKVTFRLVDIIEAETARRQARIQFQAIVDAIRPVAGEAPLAERLMSGNLVSGVVNGCA